MNFFRSIFSCCRPDIEAEAQNEENLQLQQEINSKVKSMRRRRSNSSSSHNVLLFPNKFIRPDEVGIIEFTKKGILSFIKCLTELDNYSQLYKDDTLTMFIRKEGSPITSSFFLAKAIKILPKTLFNYKVNKEDLIKVIYDPQERMKWDKGIKLQEHIEMFTTETYINRTISNKFLMIISERDFVDKRAEWYEDDVYYNFQTSIPEELYQSNEGVVRVKTYLNAFVVKEDEEKIEIVFMNQIDIKMNISQKMAEITAPVQIKEWYKKIVNGVNDYLKRKNEKEKDNEGILD